MQIQDGFVSHRSPRVVDPLASRVPAAGLLPTLWKSAQYPRVLCVRTPFTRRMLPAAPVPAHSPDAYRFLRRLQDGVQVEAARHALPQTASFGQRGRPDCGTALSGILAGVMEMPFP